MIIKDINSDIIASADLEKFVPIRSVLPVENEVDMLAKSHTDMMKDLQNKGSNLCSSNAPRLKSILERASRKFKEFIYEFLLKEGLVIFSYKKYSLGTGDLVYDYPKLRYITLPRPIAELSSYNRNNRSHYTHGIKDIKIRLYMTYRMGPYELLIKYEDISNELDLLNAPITRDYICIKVMTQGLHRYDLTGTGYDIRYLESNTTDDRMVPMNDLDEVWKELKIITETVKFKDKLVSTILN